MIFKVLITFLPFLTLALTAPGFGWYHEDHGDFHDHGKDDEHDDFDYYHDPDHEWDESWHHGHHDFKHHDHDHHNKDTHHDNFEAHVKHEPYKHFNPESHTEQGHFTSGFDLHAGYKNTEAKKSDDFVTNQNIRDHVEHMTDKSKLHDNIESHDITSVLETVGIVNSSDVNNKEESLIETTTLGSFEDDAILSGQISINDESKILTQVTASDIGTINANDEFKDSGSIFNSQSQINNNDNIKIQQNLSSDLNSFSALKDLFAQSNIDNDKTDIEGQVAIASSSYDQHLIKNESNIGENGITSQSYTHEQTGNTYVNTDSNKHDFISLGSVNTEKITNSSHTETSLGDVNAQSYFNQQDYIGQTNIESQQINGDSYNSQINETITNITEALGDIFAADLTKEDSVSLVHVETISSQERNTSHSRTITTSGDLDAYKNFAQLDLINQGNVDIHETKTNIHSNSETELGNANAQTNFDKVTVNKGFENDQKTANVQTDLKRDIKFTSDNYFFQGELDKSADTAKIYTNKPDPETTNINETIKKQSEFSSNKTNIENHLPYDNSSTSNTNYDKHKDIHVLEQDHDHEHEDYWDFDDSDDGFSDHGDFDHLKKHKVPEKNPNPGDLHKGGHQDFHGHGYYGGHNVHIYPYIYSGQQGYGEHGQTEKYPDYNQNNKKGGHQESGYGSLSVFNSQNKPQANGGSDLSNGAHYENFNNGNRKGGHKNGGYGDFGGPSGHNGQDHSQQTFSNQGEHNANNKWDHKQGDKGDFHNHEGYVNLQNNLDINQGGSVENNQGWHSEGNDSNKNDQANKKVNYGHYHKI